MDDWMKRIDWAELRSQKDWLSFQATPEADGLLNLLDALQDAAVDVYGLPESLVFGAKRKED